MHDARAIANEFLRLNGGPMNVADDAVVRLFSLDDPPCTLGRIIGDAGHFSGFQHFGAVTGSIQCRRCPVDQNRERF